MASKTITFTIDNSCSAGGHAELTTFVDGGEIAKKTIQWVDEKESPTNPELKGALYTLVRHVIDLSGADTKDEVVIVVNGLSITIDYPVP